MPDLPTYHIHRATAPISIDGVLGEADWQAAEVVSLVETEHGIAPKQRTELRLLWDDDYLYVGFHCIDIDIYSDITERDGPLWEQEVVEAFIDDDSNGITYLEYEINPRNALVDLYVVNRNGRRDDIQFMQEWNSTGTRHVVSVDGNPAKLGTDDRSWTVEWALPWTDFATAKHAPPIDGDTWRGNFYRIDRAHVDGMRVEADDEYSAWSATGEINFHRPDRFGTLLFTTEPVR
jgi:hypothetical protein